MEFRKLTVLGFHKIGEPSDGIWHTWNYISVDQFAAYMTFLADGGFRVIDYCTFIDGLSRPQLFGPRDALLTFNDGYRSTLTEALPVLKKFGFPAIVFVPTAFVAGMNWFDHDIEPEEPICTWDELRELECNDVAVQSHGVNHWRFSQLREAEVLAELTDSKSSIEAHLGRSVQVLAFPYGDPGEASASSRLLMRAGYRSAFLYAGGVTPLPIAEPFGLNRIAVGPDSDLRAILLGRTAD